MTSLEQGTPLNPILQTSTDFITINNIELGEWDEVKNFPKRYCNSRQVCQDFCWRFSSIIKTSLAVVRQGVFIGHIYTTEQRGIVKVKCLTQEDNIQTYQPRHEPIFHPIDTIGRNYRSQRQVNNGLLRTKRAENLFIDKVYICTQFEAEVKQPRRNKYFTMIHVACSTECRNRTWAGKCRTFDTIENRTCILKISQKMRPIRIQVSRLYVLDCIRPNLPVM